MGQSLVNAQKIPKVSTRLSAATLYTANGPSARTVCTRQSSGFLYNFPPAFFEILEEGDSGMGPFLAEPR